jgi:lysophospholipase L1-like esterase
MDYDGDGADDPGVYGYPSGRWMIRLSATGGQRFEAFGSTTSQPALGDFDGDGRADLALYGAASCRFLVLLSGSGQLLSVKMPVTNARPVHGDFDGDGRADLAVHSPFGGVWTIRDSASGAIRSVSFGGSLTRPVPADFDGDGTTDLAVYSRGNGSWLIQQSSDGHLRHASLGHAGARPVVGDFDGDGKDDPAVFERASGNWFWIASSDGSSQGANWGGRSTRPAPGDYDGDGTTDLAVLDQAADRWLVRLSGSSNALWEVHLGATGTPLAAFRDGGIAGLRAVAFGDSITYGMGSRSNGPTTGYPRLLESVAGTALGGHCFVLNADLPGETTSRGRTRLPAWLSSYAPDVLLLLEGTNDAFFNSPPTGTAANLRAMVQQAASVGSPAVVGTVPPVINAPSRNRSAQAARIRTLNPYIYSQVATPTGSRVAQLYERIVARSGWERTLIDGSTGNHPNDAGYAILRDEFLRQLTTGQLEGRYF